MDFDESYFAEGRANWFEANKPLSGIQRRRANVLIVFVCPGLCEFPKHTNVQHDDSAVFEADPVSHSPGAQLLVDAFPSHADHLANFLLSDRDGSASRRGFVFLGQAKESAGEPPRQVL